MANRRLVQHRQQREANTRDAAELKKENTRLKRQVARLRKQVELLESPEEEEAPEEVLERTSPKCPKCGSTDLGEISTPAGKKVSSCRACRNWRSRAT